MAKKQDDNTMTIARKITLIPVASERKEWKKRIDAFLEKDFPRQIEIKKKQIKNTSKPERVDGYKQQLAELEKQYKDFKENGIKEYTHKMASDYTYDIVRRAMESEARRKNYILSYIYTKMIQDEVANLPTLTEKNKWVSANVKECYRKAGNKNGSIFTNVDIDNPLAGYGSDFGQAFTRKIKKLIKDGILEGNVSVPNYKLDSPFALSNQNFGIFTDCENITELKKNIGKPTYPVYVCLGKHGLPTIAKFKINFGHKQNKNKAELISTIIKILTGEYSVGGSTFGIDDDKIEMNLSITMQKQKMDLDENTVVGVDLGLAVPAVCALNNNEYDKQYIGSGNDLVTRRTKFQNEYTQLQKALKLAKGGHGRKRKLLALERLKEKEKNFVDTYCHRVSKKVVDYAIKHRAKYINIENLKGYDSSEFVLRNWSFYKLQQYITYKAEQCGIEVRKINPSFTSQVCSFCGHWEEGQRKDQATFKCKNPNCKSHKLYTVNADYNAARNIAMSTQFTDDKFKCSKETIQDAADYYGIVLEDDKNNDNKKAA